MQASITDEEKENVSIDIAKSLEQIDQIENLPLGQYLKKLDDRANTAKQENKLLKGQAIAQRPGTGRIKKGKNKKQKELIGPKEPKGLKNQKDRKGQKGKGKKLPLLQQKLLQKRIKERLTKNRNGQPQEIKLQEVRRKAKYPRNNTLREKSGKLEVRRNHIIQQ